MSLFFSTSLNQIFLEDYIKMMETVDIIKDLLKTAMKGQKGEEKKKRPNEETDKEGRRKDRRTCYGPVVEMRCRHLEQCEQR